MKIRTTRKKMEQKYDNILIAPYGKLQTILATSRLQPSFCLFGKYGWQADIYEIDHRTAISIGYEPNISKEKDVPFDGYLEILFEGRALKGAREGKSQEYFKELFELFLEEVATVIRTYRSYKSYRSKAV